MAFLDRLEKSIDRTAGKFSSMLGDGPEQGASFIDQAQQGGGGPSWGSMAGQGSGGPTWGGLATQGNGPSFTWGGLSGQGHAGLDMSWLTALNNVRGQAAADQAAAKGNGGAGFSNGGGGTGGGGDFGQGGNATYTGLPADVAKWADQANQTFGDQGGWVPAAMLAIIQHESEGNPSAYNGASAGGAWGLFQQMGLGSYDPNTQFAAAKQLLQEKLKITNDAYAALGLNPDERTRARDLFLAWAGQFDPKTAGPNGNRDEGNGQDAEAFLNGPRGIMPMYDNVVKGRQQASAPGGSTGMAGITPGVGGQIMQEFGPTDYAQAHPSTYAYGNAYGLTGSQHPGVDWAVPMGTKVATPMGGTVSVVGNDHGTGYYYTNTMSGSDPNRSGEFAITLDNGDILILGHMSQINVNVGDRLSAGALIGLSGGSDGAHVHVEYRKKLPGGGYQIVDPRTMLGQPTGGGGAGYR